jgi:dCTP deaminase
MNTGFWSGEKLLKNKHIIEPFDSEQIDCNAYTLRMGNLYYRTADQESGVEQKKTFLKDYEALLIPPGQFAYLLTKESVHIPPDSMAFISMRTSIKFQGLINVSGFHVDPGYNGKLVYAVYNASPSPVQICENDPVFKIWFCSLDQTSEYIFRDRVFNDITGEMIKGMNKEILSLQSLADKMRDLKSVVESKFAEQKPTIDNLTFVWRTITLGVVGAILLSIVALALPTLYRAGGAVLDKWWPSQSDSTSFQDYLPP